MKWKRRHSDEELITRVKRNIEFWDRLRYFRIAFAVVLVVVELVFFSLGFRFITELSQDEPDAAVQFWSQLGALLGFMFGFNSFVLLFWLSFLMSGFRSNRLLLKYHEALQNPEQSETEETPA